MIANDREGAFAANDRRKRVGIVYRTDQNRYVIFARERACRGIHEPQILTGWFCFVLVYPIPTDLLYLPLQKTDQEQDSSSDEDKGEEDEDEEDEDDNNQDSNNVTKVKQNNWL